MSLNAASTRDRYRQRRRQRHRLRGRAADPGDRDADRRSGAVGSIQTEWSERLARGERRRGRRIRRRPRRIS